jgi:hypothetical protein
MPSLTSVPGLLLYSLLAFLAIVAYRSWLFKFIEREVDFDAGLKRSFKERQMSRNVEAEQLLSKVI